MSGGCLTYICGTQYQTNCVEPTESGPWTTSLRQLFDQGGVPVVYLNCVAPAVRVVHPVNPNAPAKNMGLVMFYIPPHAILEPGSHETEETYVILEGSGTMTFGSGPREVKKGDFVYLPPWCLHGIENTGTEMLVVLICTSPPNP